MQSKESDTSVNAYRTNKLVSITDISKIPGAELLYRSYTRHRRNKLIVLHIFGFIFELTSLITGTLISEASDDEHTTTPFTIQKWFVFGFWVYLIIHRSTFLPILFSNSLTSIDLI
jgi:hypothetical protein